MIGVSPYLLVPLLLVVTLFQVTVLPELTILGVKPELMLLAVLGWSLLRGPEEGMIWAFLGGALLDLFSGGPFGASILALLAISYLSAWLEPSVGRASFLLPMGAALVGTLLYQAIFLLVIQLTRGGVPWIESLLRVTLPSLAINALLMPVVFQALAWFDRKIGRPMIRW
jgi:rod shape-determining protein MreD